MKKRNIIVLIIAISIGNMAMAAPLNQSGENSEAPAAPAYSFNNSKSTLQWIGTKPGGEHQGTIELISGIARTNGNTLSGGSFEIDMTSVKNEDITNDGMRKRLVDHLKSEDFFYVEKYPKANFEISKVQVSTSSSHIITGALTIRGNTHEVSFPADITVEEDFIHARTGDIALDRTRWEVNHKSKSVFAALKDNFIADEMIIKMDIYLSRN